MSKWNEQIISEDILKKLLQKDLLTFLKRMSH